MTGKESPAQLEWWANGSTCLACVPVSVTAEEAAGPWDAALSPELDDEGLRFLIELSPYFTLRLADDSVTGVLVEHSGDLGRLRLSAAS